jgi:hypothetical protein
MHFLIYMQMMMMFDVEGVTVGRETSTATTSSDLVSFPLAPLHPLSAIAGCGKSVFALCAHSVNCISCAINLFH